MWHRYSHSVNTGTRDEQMSARLSLRNAIEGRRVILGERELELRLVGFTEDAGGGTTVTIAIAGATEPLQMSVSDELLDDPIALRLRVQYFVRRTVGTLAAGHHAAVQHR